MSSGEKAAIFQDVSLDRVSDLLLALTTHKAEEFIPVGSGVIVGAHLAITAKHVIEEVWKLQDSDFNKRFGNNSPLPIVARQYLNHGRQMALWQVKRSWFDPATDLAVMFIVPSSKDAETYQWRNLDIDLAPPQKGSKVTAFGFRDSQIILREPNADSKVTWYDWHDRSACSQGEVGEVHCEKRDKGMLKFPCFEIRTRIDHGMSGGPVIDSMGCLCGLVCSGSSQVDETQTHLSYASTLWPLLGVELDAPWKIVPEGTKYTILDLAAAGVLRMKHLDRVSLKRNPDGEVVEIEMLRAG